MRVAAAKTDRAGQSARRIGHREIETTTTTTTTTSTQTKRRRRKDGMRIASVSAAVAFRRNAASLIAPSMLRMVGVGAAFRLAPAALFSARFASRFSKPQEETNNKNNISNIETSSSSEGFSPLFEAVASEAQSAITGVSAETANAQSAGKQGTAAVAVHTIAAVRRAEELAATSSSRRAITEAREKFTSLLPTFTTGNMHVSPRKLNHLARLLRRQTIKDALRQMMHTPKRRGVQIAGTLRRVAAVLRHNYGVDPNLVVIAQAIVGKGTYLRRIRIHARGRFGTMHRPRAHIKIILGPCPPVATQADRDLESVANLIRKNKLHTGILDSRPNTSPYPIWSKKPWKYITHERWLNPDRAFPKSK